MVTSEIIGRVLRISVGPKNGTAFTIEYDGVQFLVTAKHLFEPVNYPSKTTISILQSGGYKCFDVDIRYPTSPTIDIAVMKTNPYETLTASYENENTMTGISIGQDVYFLGFPYDFDNLLQQSPFNNTPLPFVKKACMSSIIK